MIRGQFLNGSIHTGKCHSTAKKSDYVVYFLSFK